ncbi:Hypothetical predicted protein [Marmota monax]|uniref:Uncharacterized protein n=1 Tax=Marmota monax TaxID=9995 RepID=A0A5E4A3R6_MARMO|nr:hypothetical protein GHT09_015532 [Marmota monax]VTJ51362.1 Hypothetical predicted protein [Marmota monax]
MHFEMKCGLFIECAPSRQGPPPRPETLYAERVTCSCKVLAAKEMLSMSPSLSPLTHTRTPKKKKTKPGADEPDEIFSTRWSLLEAFLFRERGPQSLPLHVHTPLV